MKCQGKAPQGRSAEGRRAQEACKVTGVQGGTSLLWGLRNSLMYSLPVLNTAAMQKLQLLPPQNLTPASFPLFPVFLLTHFLLLFWVQGVELGWKGGSVWASWPQALKALRHGASPLIAGLSCLKQEVFCPLRFLLWWQNSPFNRLKQRQRFSRISYSEYFKWFHEICHKVTVNCLQCYEIQFPGLCSRNFHLHYFIQSLVNKCVK